MGRRTKHDFDVAFQDLQELHLLKQKLFRAVMVLDSNRSLCGNLQRFPWGEEGQLLTELGNCDNLVEVYSRRTSMSIKFAEDTDRLVSLGRLLIIGHLLIGMNKLCRVLDARHDELFLQTNTAMQENLGVLKQIAFINGEENQKLSKISSHTLKDSNTLKALTTVATMYLPASLIAVSAAMQLVTAILTTCCRQSSAQALFRSSSKSRMLRKGSLSLESSGSTFWRRAC